MGSTVNEGVLRVGVVGVGVISQQYFEHFPALPGLELAAVADLDVARAQQVGAAQGVRGTTVDDLLAADDVDVVLNLTIPAAHADIATRALAAGKHVYGEKPLAMSTAEAAPVLEAARAAGLRVGSAPDTVLGTGIQTARAALDDGVIGTPVGAAVVLERTRARALAPGAGLLLPAGRRSAPRHGAVLPDQPRHVLRARRAGQRQRHPLHP